MGREGRLERLDLRPVHVVAGRDHLEHGRVERLAHVRELRLEVEQGDSHGR